MTTTGEFDMEEPSIIDISIAKMRSKPLSQDELDAMFSPKKKQGPRILPWATVKAIKIGGKDKLIPFIGIQGTF